MAAEPPEARLKGDASAAARLGEDHCEGLVRKRPVARSAGGERRLDPLCEVEHLAHLGGAQVVDVQKVALPGRELRLAVGGGQHRRALTCRPAADGVR